MRRWDKEMKNIPSFVKNFSVSVFILCVSFGLSLLLQTFTMHEHIVTVFVFAVFLVSLMTDGYIYGIISAVMGMLAINFAFTFPYLAFNFTIPENFFSALIMITVAITTSTLTTKLKKQEVIKSERDKERMRADLLRAVSHDLRTPLTTIYGSSSAILENSATLTEEQKNKMLQGIKEDSEWLTRMVENLLSITRLDGGNVKILKTSVVLDELIDSVIVKMRKRYPETNIEIDIPDEVVLIPMDAILIEQVIINLLENSIRHAKGMSKLALRVFTISDRVIFEVTDDGCGIEPERLKNIFNGYYDSKELPADSRKRNAGIGLSVCSTIIKAHGGTIRAENAKSGGAIFRFTLELDNIA